MKKRILFVCMGNICRSPSAEAVFNAKLREKELQDVYECDSAGTIGYHAGEPADERMQRHANQRGYRLTSISRKVDVKSDFEDFDLIIGMDDDNMEALEQMQSRTEGKAKLYKMTDFCTTFEERSVPDPYYGGAAGFEQVLDLLEDACEGLINHLESE